MSQTEPTNSEPLQAPEEAQPPQPVADMPRRAQREPEKQPRSEEASRMGRVWAIIGGIATVAGIIGTVIAFFAFRQQITDSASSDQVQATMVAILARQLEVQQEVATVQALPADSAPTATAIAQRLEQLAETQQLLADERIQVEATQTAITQGQTSANSDPRSEQLPIGPLVLNCPASLDFGQTAECGVDAVAEIDQYTFNADVNDQLLLRIHKFAGNFAPKIAISDPNGNLICQGSDANAVNIALCSITTSGKHSIAIDDYYKKSTGKYRLYIQRLNNAGMAKQGTFGAPATGNLISVGSVESYQLQAEINDQLLIRLHKTAGAFAPKVSVYDQSGQAICEHSDDSIVQIACSITASGVYTILVDDYYRRATGTYDLFMQRLNNPGGTVAIRKGQSLNGAIEQIASFDTYAFSAQAGDTITVQVARKTGAFEPRIRLYDAAGTVVCEAADNTTAQTTNCTLSAVGNYTILVDDYRVSRVGEYTIELN